MKLLLTIARRFFLFDIFAHAYAEKPCPKFWTEDDVYTVQHGVQKVLLHIRHKLLEEGKSFYESELHLMLTEMAGLYAKVSWIYPHARTLMFVVHAPCRFIKHLRKCYPLAATSNAQPIVFSFFGKLDLMLDYAQN